MRSFHDYTSMCLRRGRRRFPGGSLPASAGLVLRLEWLPDRPAQSRWARTALDGPWRAKLSERGMYQRFRGAVVGSQHMGRVLRINGFSEQRIHVVPYFSRFDQQAQQPQATGKPALQGRPPQLLFAGQAVKGKGLEVLVKALAEIRVTGASSPSAAVRAWRRHAGWRRNCN